VLNISGHLIGLVHKNFLIILIEQHHWYKGDGVRDVEYDPHKHADLYRNTTGILGALQTTSQKVIDSNGRESLMIKSIDWRSAPERINTMRSQRKKIHDDADKIRQAYSQDFENSGKDPEVKSDELPWEYFNSDFESRDRTYEEVKDICEKYGDKTIDVRPYMIQSPYTVTTEDKLKKCVELFRYMHLRTLLVNSPYDGHLVGIITR